MEKEPSIPSVANMSYAFSSCTGLQIKFSFVLVFLLYCGAEESLKGVPVCFLDDLIAFLHCHNI